MTIDELNGLVDAVEAESRNPNPSHQNLARLCGMFFRELIQHLDAPMQIATVTPPESETGTNAPVETPPVNYSNDDFPLDKPKPKKGKKKS